MTRQDKLRYINGYCQLEGVCNKCPCYNEATDDCKDLTHASDEMLDSFIDTIKQLDGEADGFALELSIDTKLEHDAVNHPSHYTDGKIEVIDFINDKHLNFNRGNVVKYVARAGKKDASKEIEDLEKARFYLNDEIKRLKDESRTKS